MNLDRAASIDDLRLQAKRRLPRVCFDFIDGGADGEVTLRMNREAFDKLTFRPRYLVDVAVRELATEAAGTAISMPVILAPTGLTRVAERNAEINAARAAGAAGTVYCLSTLASTNIEDVARAASGPLWFQLCPWSDHDLSRSLIRRARDCGYSALIVTTDAPVASKRERDARNGFGLPLRLSVADRLEAARHPAWVWGYLTGRPITFANLAEKANTSKAEVLGKWVKELHNPAATYADLSRLREEWSGPLIVKGVLTPEDAEMAIGCGADALVVSNHGGRQLDCAQPSIDALPAIVAAVGGRAEIMLDSGVRRGSDVVKAIALGAKAVLVGRPFIWGLAAAGEKGAQRALDILRAEIDVCLTLIGRSSVADLDDSALTAPREPERRQPSTGTIRE